MMFSTLDVGCGYMLRQTFRGQINLDINKPEKPVPDFVRGDCHHLPFRSGCFESVYFYHVVEHIESPFQALKEICRVLAYPFCVWKTHELVIGKLHLATPNSLHLYKTLRTVVKGSYVPYDGREAGAMNAHIQTWGVPELRNLLRVSGFCGFEFRFVNHGARKLLDFFANRFGLSRTLEVTCHKT